MNPGNAHQKDDKPAFQTFTGTGVSLGGGPNPDVIMSDEDAALIAQYGDDPELLMAIKASMQEEQMKAIQVPDEPPADADPATVVTI